MPLAATIGQIGAIKLKRVNPFPGNLLKPDYQTQRRKQHFGRAEKR